MKVCSLIAGIAICLASSPAVAQQDTVKISSDMINTKVLKNGTHRYLVYFKLGKDSSRINYQLWSRTIDHLDYQGRKAISVTQEWEDNTKIVHKVYSVCDEKTFAPLYQKSEWIGRLNSTFNFLTKEGYVNDTLLTSADTARTKKQAYDGFQKAMNEYVLNWHLDLEVFPILPYKQGRTFLVNFYDPGFSSPAFQAYTVSGSATLTGYDNQEIECWLLTHTSRNNTETFWISKKTREVLKLEQVFGGRFRYKIKLGFSM